MIASAKSDYETNLALTYAHSNNNQIFQCISNIKGQDHYPIEMSYNDTTASNDSKKAEIFNEHFYSVFTCSNLETDEDGIDATPTTGTLNDIVISEPDVLDMLKSLQLNKVSGIDNISPKLLKNCALPLLHIIYHLFTVSLSNSKIPKDWCTHCVIPIFKSGDKSSVCNYKSISLLRILFYVFSPKCWKELFKTVHRNMWKEDSQIISLVFFQTDLPYNYC